MEADADSLEMTRVEVRRLMAELHTIDTTSLEHLKRPPKVRAHIHAIVRAPFDQYEGTREERKFSGEKAGFPGFQAQADAKADAQSAVYRKRWPMLVLAQEVYELCDGSDEPDRQAAFAKLQDFDVNQADLSWVSALAVSLGLAVPSAARRGPPVAGRFRTTDEFLMPAMHRLVTRREQTTHPRIKPMSISQAAHALAEFAFGAPGDCKRLRLEDRYRAYRRTLADAAQVVDRVPGKLGIEV